MADYAALDFAAETRIVADALPPPAQWREQANADLLLLKIAAAIMQKNPAEMHQMALEMGTETMMETVDGFTQFRDRHKAYAEVAQSAMIRAMAGLARVVVSQGQGA